MFAWTLASPRPIGKIAKNPEPPVMLSRFFLAVLIWATAGFATSGIAAEEDGPAIYFGVTSGTARPVVVTFVFSKPGGFDPIIGFSMAPIAGSCNFHRPAELELPLEYRNSILYEPGISPAGLTPDKFAEFFSAVVPAELIKKGLLATEEEGRPFGACTRELWEGLLDPSPKHRQ
jgi:hypothetical protein